IGAPPSSPGLKTKEALNRRRHTPPILGFPGESSPPGCSNGVKSRLAILLGRSPLGSNPSFLLHSQESRIESALVEPQHVFADLLDPARNAVTVQRSERLQRSQNEKNQSTLENIRLVCTRTSH